MYFSNKNKVKQTNLLIYLICFIECTFIVIVVCVDVRERTLLCVRVFNYLGLRIYILIKSCTQ